MKKRKKRTLRPWLVVATAHTARGLAEAAALGPRDGIDLVEVRLDCLLREAARIPRALARIKLPIILTARHPGEGGSGRLSDRQRAALLEPLLPHAAYVDVEIRNAGRLADVLRRARRSGVRTILSFHDFRHTPSVERLRAKLREGVRAGAAVVKIATVTRDARDLAALLSLQAAGGARLATMGMGPLGKVSRLVLPLAGSRLVYGYLDRPQVGGQWPARLLAARLAEAAG